MPDLQSIGGILAVLAGIAAILRRKHAIGGWLFYFFCQVFLGLVLIVASTHWNLYSSRAWGEPARYFLYVLSNLSRAVLLTAIGAVGMMLAVTREWRWVCALRYALATYALLTALKVQADVFCFPSAIQRDTLSMAFPFVWMVYFGVSRRVRRVFPEESRED